MMREEEAGPQTEGRGQQQQQQRRRLLNEDDSGGIAEVEGKWMGILSRMDAQLFAHVLSSEDLGVVHLE